MSTEYINPQWRLPNYKTGNNQDYSMDFGGSQAVVASNFTAFNGAESASFSLWYKTSTTMQGKCLLSFPNTSGANRLDLYIYTANLPGQSPPRPGFISYIITSGGDPTHGSNLTSTATGLSPADGNWHNVIVAWDGATINMYYDGVSIGSMAKDGSLTSSSVDTLNISMFGAGPYTNYFTGQIKDVAVFDYGLPATGSNSVATIYNSGTPFNPMALSSPPINYYPLGNSAHMGSDYLTPNGALQDYVFDFVNDYIETKGVGDVLGNACTNFTIAFWFNHDQTPSTSGLYEFDASPTTAGTGQHGIRLLSNTRFEIIYKGTLNGAAHDGRSRYNMPSGLNTWTHLVVSFDGTNNTALYVNGQPATLYQQYKATPDSVDFAGTSVDIGIYNTNNALYRYDGKMSNFQVFNSSLTATEAETLYNYGSPIQTLANIPQSSNLKAWYKLDASEIYNSVSTEWEVSNATAAIKNTIFDPENSSGTPCYKENTAGGLLPLTGAAGQSTTIALWYYAAGNADNIIFNRLENGAYWFGKQTSNNLRFLFTNNSGWTLGPSVPRDQWNHIVLTVVEGGTGVGRTVKFYVNGGSPTTVTDSSGNLANITSQKNQFGSISYSSTNTDILSSNYVYYNTALSDSEVVSLYNSFSPDSENTPTVQPDLSSFPKNSNITGWFKSDGLDSSGQGNNGSAEGSILLGPAVSLTNGKSSGMKEDNLVQSDLLTTSSYSPYALAFDGNDYLTASNSTVYSSYSISCWINATSLSNFTRLVSLDSGNHRFLGLHGDGTLISGYNSGDWNELFTTSTITTGTWNHIVLVDNGTNTKIYVNTAENTLSNSIAVDGPNYYIGSYNGGGNFFDGKMSNISIWNYSLNPSQVREIYNEGLPSDLNTFSGTAPVTWWQLGSNSSYDGSDWTCLDEIGSTNATSQSMLENAIVDGVRTSGNGVSANMGTATNISGSSPNGEGNSLSVNMTLANIAAGVN